MITQKQKTFAIYALPLGLLCIPLFGNIISDEVHWTASDFIVAGGLLFTTAFLINLVRSRVKNLGRKVLICVTILLILALVWAELAVGIFGSPLAGS
ncbi:MAG: hypothetical protein LBE92_13825 [Chryseobacterium sp.]|jgi:hypothetical protein|uniref:hypothetical protein n=1 Tax=Chryseobacterium sp. TaxID=1871047 RepID=UPI0028299DAF|nr:hypothetical protein [Chryseobacterium sp.]MDR2237195.1 hypothetical protein [Chryseobacterium sp.]